MTFTEEDIGNDALIKEEVGPKLQGLASREQPRILEYYEKLLTEDYGLSVGQDLADMLVRALEDEDFAERILNTEVTLRQARINSIREDDLEFVMELQERFSDDDPEDRVGQFIDRYMDSVVGGAGGLGLGVTDKRRESGDDTIDRKIQEMREERIKLENTLQEIKEAKRTPSSDTVVSEESDEREDVSSLFDRGDDDEGQRDDTTDSVDEKQSDSDDTGGSDGTAFSSEEGVDDE